MSLPSSAQLSPRILAVYERLDEAVSRLKLSVEARTEKVDAKELVELQNQFEGLKQDNFALSEALAAYSEVDADAEFEKLNDQIETLRDKNTQLDSEKQSLKDLNSDISVRLGKLIGNVQHVLEEE